MRRKHTGGRISVLLALILTGVLLGGCAVPDLSSLRGIFSAEENAAASGEEDPAEGGEEENSDPEISEQEDGTRALADLGKGYTPGELTREFTSWDGRISLCIPEAWGNIEEQLSAEGLKAEEWPLQVGCAEEAIFVVGCREAKDEELTPELQDYAEAITDGVLRSPELTDAEQLSRETFEVGEKKLSAIQNVITADREDQHLVYIIGTVELEDFTYLQLSAWTTASRLEQALTTCTSLLESAADRTA